jgi:hypothetical protein
MEAAKALVIYCHEKAMMPPESIRSCRRAWATCSRSIQRSRIDSERLRRRGDDITRCALGSDRLHHDRIDALLMSSLEQCSFHSPRTLISTIKHPSATVWRHLHSAVFVVCNLFLVPYEPSPSQKLERVRMAIELQQMLQASIHRAWRYFLTGDESWFYCTMDHDHM